MVVLIAGRMQRCLWPARAATAARRTAAPATPPPLSRKNTGTRALASLRNDGGKRRLVFLGTPDVGAIVLEELLAAARAPGSSFEVAAVVSQPGKPKGRGNRATPVPSAVEALARASGAVPEDRIWCPKTARDPEFLAALAALEPDLCVTAAYGNMLPAAFLAVPRRGTLNVHPSLLPLYRGAAPVQRALQDGAAETGVSVAFTVLACDAGPVLEQLRVAPGADETAPELLARLFRLGARALVARLDEVWDGRAAAAAQVQDEAAATHAPKLAKEEAQLDFSRPARRLHDQVRAFTPWPGTVGEFELVSPAAGDTGDSGGARERERVSIKILETRVADAALLPEGAAARRAVAWAPGGRMLVPCGRGEGGGNGGGGATALEVLSLQLPAKKPVGARDFFNGLKGREVFVAPPPGASGDSGSTSSSNTSSSSGSSQPRGAAAPAG